MKGEKVLKKPASEMKYKSKWIREGYKKNDLRIFIV
jgi:hypothetical protein